MRIIQIATAATLISLSTAALGTQDNWFVRPYVGLSHMSDPDADYSEIDNMSGDADVDLDTGFTAGVGWVITIPTTLQLKSAGNIAPTIPR